MLHPDRKFFLRLSLYHFRTSRPVRFVFQGYKTCQNYLGYNRPQANIDQWSIYVTESWTKHSRYR